MEDKRERDDLPSVRQDIGNVASTAYDAKRLYDGAKNLSGRLQNSSVNPSNVKLNNGSSPLPGVSASGLGTASGAADGAQAASKLASAAEKAVDAGAAVASGGTSLAATAGKEAAKQAGKQAAKQAIKQTAKNASEREDDKLRNPQKKSGCCIATLASLGIGTVLIILLLMSPFILLALVVDEGKTWLKEKVDTVGTYFEPKEKAEFFKELYKADSYDLNLYREIHNQHDVDAQNAYIYEAIIDEGIEKAFRETIPEYITTFGNYLTDAFTMYDVYAQTLMFREQRYPYCKDKSDGKYYTVGDYLDGNIPADELNNDINYAEIITIICQNPDYANQHLSYSDFYDVVVNGTPKLLYEMYMDKDNVTYFYQEEEVGEDGKPVIRFYDTEEEAVNDYIAQRDGVMLDQKAKAELTIGENEELNFIFNEEYALKDYGINEEDFKKEEKSEEPETQKESRDEETASSSLPAENFLASLDKDGIELVPNYLTLTMTYKNSETSLIPDQSTKTFIAAATTSKTSSTTASTSTSKTKDTTTAKTPSKDATDTTKKTSTKGTSNSLLQHVIKNIIDKAEEYVKEHEDEHNKEDSEDTPEETEKPVYQETEIKKTIKNVEYTFKGKIGYVYHIDVAPYGLLDIYALAGVSMMGDNILVENRTNFQMLEQSEKNIRDYLHDGELGPGSNEALLPNSLKFSYHIDFGQELTYRSMIYYLPETVTSEYWQDSIILADNLSYALNLNYVPTGESVILNMPVYINQGDYTNVRACGWGHTIKQEGCLDCSCVMVLSYYQKKALNITDFSCSKSWVDNNCMFQTKKFGETYGLENTTGQEIFDAQKIRDHLTEGNPVILHIRGIWDADDGLGKGYHTSSNGHFLLIVGYDDDGFYVYDPGSRLNTETRKKIPYKAFGRVSDLYVRYVRTTDPNFIPSYSVNTMLSAE